MFLYNVLFSNLKGSYFWSTVFPSILHSGGNSCPKSLLITINSPGWKIKQIMR